MTKNFKIIILLFLLIILNLLNIYTYRIIKSDYIMCILLLIFTIISIHLFGFVKQKSRYSKDIIISILIYCFIYYLITYLLGIIIGFNHNIYDNNKINIIKNVTPIIIKIILEEILRYIIIRKIKGNLKLIITTIIAFVIIDNYNIIGNINYKDLNDIIVSYGIYILPSISTNILLTYLTIKIGYKTSIVYQLLIKIPSYIVPIIPAFGLYIWSCIYLIFPIIILKNINKNIKKTTTKKRTKHQKYLISKIIYINMIGIFLVIMYLTSNLFKYKAIVIASGSMEPIIYRGDIVIIKTLSDLETEKLQKGEIIAYTKEKK